MNYEKTKMAVLAAMMRGERQFEIPHISGDGILLGTSIYFSLPSIQTSGTMAQNKSYNSIAAEEFIKTHKLARKVLNIFG